MTYVETIAGQIQTLRSKIAQERQLYIQMREKLELFHPNEWRLVAEAIKSIALYYRSEIVRTKHYTARYMQGHDISIPEEKTALIDALHKQIDGLPQIIDDYAKATIAYEQEQSDPVKSADLKMGLHQELDVLEAELHLLEETTKLIVEESYDLG